MVFVRAGLAGFIVCFVGAVACDDHAPSFDRLGDPLLDAGPDVDPCASVASTGKLPCAVEQVLVAKCQRCHNDDDPRPNFAPFPLLRFEDTRLAYGDQPVWKRMKPAVESGFMPLVSAGLDPNGEPLTASEKATLLAWLGSCAAPATIEDRCPDPDGGGDAAADAAADASDDSAADAPLDAPGDGNGG
jgi:hypothetical protein